MKPLKLAILALVVLALLGAGVTQVPNIFDWYMDLRYPVSPKLAVGGTNWSHPSGTVAMAMTDGPQWASTEQAMNRQEADLKLKNPIASSPESIAQGKTLFLIYCAPCHGPEGRGDGAVAARALFPPPSLPAAAGRRSEGFLYATIRNGGAVMPSFGHALAPSERWSVVNFLKSIAQTPPLISAGGGTSASAGAEAPLPKTLTRVDAAAGRAVFNEHCSTCHLADSDEEVVGPGLKNLFRWPAHRGADGSQHDRHTAPMIRQQIVNGGGAMAPLGDTVSGQALEDLLASLQTL